MMYFSTASSKVLQINERHLIFMISIGNGMTILCFFKKSVCFGVFFLQKCNKAWTKLNTTSYSNWNKSVNELL